MCTLSWKWSEETFHLFFNRDEALARPKALPPIVRQEKENLILCPIDPQGGGTWMGVNQQGLVIALVNDYQNPAKQAVTGLRSRGLLVLELLTEVSVDSILKAIQGMELSCYPGFLLHLFSLSEEGWQIHWNGEQLNLKEISEVKLPISSSSVYPQEAERYRQQRYSDAFSVAELREFHALYDKDAPGLSPWMKRDDAKTQSYTEIELNLHEAKIWYGETVSTALDNKVSCLKFHD